jgi:hypothetical protein
VKAFLRLRSDWRWALLAVPVLIVAHWMIVTVGPVVVRNAVPDTVRTVLHLL